MVLEGADFEEVTIDDHVFFDLLADSFQPLSLLRLPLLAGQDGSHRFVDPFFIGKQGFVEHGMTNEAENTRGDVLIGCVFDGGLDGSFVESVLLKLQLQFFEVFSGEISWSCGHEDQSWDVGFMLNKELAERFEVILWFLIATVSALDANQRIGMFRMMIEPSAFR